MRRALARAMLARAMRLSLSLSLFAIAALVAACASTQTQRTPTTHSIDPNLPPCSGTSVHCLTAPNCQYDEAHQCQACECSPIMQTTEQRQTEAFPRP